MKANELRIGNFVYFLGNVHEIEGLSKRLRPDVGHFQLSNIEYSQKGFHLKPIQLTEEWLVKFGFVKCEKYYISPCNKSCEGFVDIMCFDLNDLEFIVTSSEYSSYSVNCKYIHTLQNLYFALTGEELQLK